MSSPTVVVLVHGTFATVGSPWIQTNSPLRRAVSEGLGAGTIVKSFSWSGANNHMARLGAGEKLKKFIDEIYSELKPQNLFVIAHSHGGNVALYPLKR